MTAANREKVRNRKIIKTAWSGLFSRVITIGVSLLMVPLALHYLGKEQYGLWVAVSSLVAMLGFMDGGAGNAVINMVAHASATKEDSLNKIVSTAFFCLMALALIGGLLFLAVFPFISWGSLLGVAESTARLDLNSVVMIVGLSFFVSLFITLVGKVQRGLQEGNLDNWWSSGGAVLSLLLVYAAIQKDAGLIGFALAFLAGPILAHVANILHYVFIRRSDLRPRFGNVDTTIAKNLFTVGGMFFVLQITATIQGQVDNVIISHMLGPAAVTNYAICMKLFLLVPMLFGLVLAPLWPAYREAFARGDMEWIRRVFYKSIRWALLISVPSATLLVLLGGDIIELWVGKAAVPPLGVLIGCGIWLIMCTVGGALAMLFSGMQLIKIQIIASVITAICNVFLSVCFIEMYGVAGAVFGSVFSWLLFTLIPYAIVAKSALNPSGLSKSD